MSWDGTLSQLPQRLDDADRTALRGAVLALEPQLRALCDEVSRSILHRQPDLVDAGDPEAVAAVHRATLANVEAIASTLAASVPPDGMDVPAGALDLLDHVAREPAALPVMLRAYRLGAAGFTQLWLAHLASCLADAGQLDRVARHSLDHVAVYVDRISEVIVERWEVVSAASVRAGRRREAALRALLSGERIEADRLEYPLALTQLVLCHRAPRDGRPEELLAAIVDAVQPAGRLELELADGTTLLWLAVAEAETRLAAVLALARQEPSGWTVAMAAAPGIEAVASAGRDVREAMAALRRVRPDGGAVVQHELALIATLLADEERALRLVHSVLGPLASATPRNVDLCDTLQAYFDAGERKTGAAALLGIHEKTVAHRLARAEELLGARVAERRAALESALVLHRAIIRPGVRAVPNSP